MAEAEAGADGLFFSCQECRAKKIKCSRTFPCDRCTRLGLDCVPQTRKRYTSASLLHRHLHCGRGRPSRTTTEAETLEGITPAEKQFFRRVKGKVEEVVSFLSSSDGLISDRLRDFAKKEMR